MTNVKENKMGTMPVGKLLISMSLPMMISMIVQALYNVVDSMFVAKISESALTALSLAFPIQNLMIAVGAGTGVGINALLSRSLGEKEYDRANKAARNGIFVIFLSFLVFMVGGLFFTEAFFKVQTTDAETIKYGTTYLRICSVFSFGLFMQVTFERLLQATGKTMYSMCSQGIGAIINIILDPILIFGLFGMPKMGVAGAAIATVIGQFVGMTMGLIFNIKVNHEINISMKGFRPDTHIIKTIYVVGIPTIIMQSIGSVMVFLMNKILITFSSTAVAVFGVYFKLQSFIFMPVFGLNNGFIPIVAYNYGARNKKRITKTTKLAVIVAAVIMAIGFAVFQLIPDKLLMMFAAEGDSLNNMLSIGVPALRIISINFVFAGVCIVLGSVFQALGKGMYSLIVSFGRQIIVLLPAAYILGQVKGLSAVWFAFPIAEMFSLVLTAIFFTKIYRNQIKNIV